MPHKDPAVHKAYHAEYRKHYRSTPEQKARYAKTSRAKQREMRRLHPAFDRSAQLKKKYGISAIEYDCMLREQNGLCAICKRPETATANGRVKALSVDHNHATQKVRSLLCGRCNVAVGFLKEDLLLVDALRQYLLLHAI